MSETQSKVTVPFAVRLNTDGHGFSFLEDSRLNGSCYKKPTTAKAYLRDAAIAQVEDALELQAHRPTLIFCGDGTVLAVLSPYSYSICRATGKGGSCICADPLERARAHAEDFGGVVNEINA